MKDTGEIISKMEKEEKYLKINLFMRAIGSMIRCKVKEFVI